MNDRCDRRTDTTPQSDLQKARVATDCANPSSAVSDTEMERQVPSEFAALEEQGEAVREEQVETELNINRQEKLNRSECPEQSNSVRDSTSFECAPVDGGIETDKSIQRDPDRLKIFLKRADQVTIGILLLICNIVFLAYVATNYFSSDGLVFIDRAESKTFNYQIDINAANWPELANLPGVGEVLARKIVEHREQNGPYTNIDALLDVRGIGQKKLEGLKEYLPHDADGNLYVEH